MKTTLLLFPLLLFLVAHADAPEFKLKCQEKPVEVRVGENVTLNCKSEPQRDLTKEQITWKFEKTKFVYMYRLYGFHDDDYQDDQDEQFKGRVHRVSDWKVSEGKLSVEISSVNENDTGVYTCSVLNGPKCTVTLTVIGKSTENTGGAQGDNTTTTSDGPDPDTIIAIVAVVLVLVAAFAAWLICSNGRTQRGREQDGEELKRTEPPTLFENLLDKISIHIGS